MGWAHRAEASDEHELPGLSRGVEAARQADELGGRHTGADFEADGIAQAAEVPAARERGEVGALSFASFTSIIRPKGTFAHCEKSLAVGESAYHRPLANKLLTVGDSIF